MDNDQLWPLLGGLLAGGMLAAVGAYAWLSGRIRQETQRHQATEQARQLGAQQLTQARRQIEQLQRENHELRLAVRPAPRPAPRAEAPVDPAEAARLYAEAKLNPAAADVPKAFKDTELLDRSGR
ncbi:hypothetical protein [Pelomonas cellulosilytica]|uniref:DUF2570 domain-containing protein n=1 Tax=Pelomonas cellulosilytica TaxID=2906762 RepID=A0ABS8XPJ8_9BURK|nr:hypothetical protein [Pelomonas sp. P8]MCE4554672.1 hypothetical protein [Pelomonas sp. P8]